MQRIIVSGIIVFFCYSTSAQKISNNTIPAKSNKFDFMAEISEKFKPRQPYSQLYADFIKKKLKSENPKADDEVLTALSKMIAVPEDKVFIKNKKSQDNDLIFQYYNALLFLADNRKEQGTKFLSKCLQQSPAMGYTRFFILLKLTKLKNSNRLASQGGKLFEKLILTHGITNKEARFFYKMMFGLGDPFFIKLAEKVKNAKQLDKWFRLILQGQTGIKLAWKSRGDGWSSTVTKEGWKGFHANLKLADKYLNEAWKMNPEYPEAPTLMITVSMGNSTIKDRIKWFRRAIEARFDHYPAYRAISNAIAPKWGGSNKLRSDLVLACLKYGRNDTNVAKYGIKMLLYLAARVSDYRWQRVFMKPDIRKQLLKYANDNLRSAKLQNEKNKALTMLALVNIYTLNYKDANEAFKKLNSGTFDKEIVKLRKEKAVPIPSWINPETLIKIFNGKNGTELRAIQRAFIIGQKTDAMLKLFVLIRSRKLTKEEKLFAADLFGRMEIDKNALLYKNVGSSSLNVGLFCKVKANIMKNLINLGIDCTVISPNRKRTSLMIASRSFRPEFVDILKKSGVDLNQRDKYGWTALEHAVYKRNIPFAKRLIELGANVNTLDNTGYSLLTEAFFWKRDKALEMLLEAGADINFQVNGSRSLLMHALGRNVDISRLKELLKHKIDLEQRCSYKGTAIIYAAKFYRNPEGLKLLIEKGAKLDAADRDGDTSLISVAAWAKSPEKIKILLKAGADINEKNKAGRTALIMAAISRRPVEELKILVEYGAKLNETDNRGNTAYDWTVKKKNKLASEYLSKHGALPASKIKNKK